MKKASSKQTRKAHRHNVWRFGFSVKLLLTLCFTLLFFGTAIPAYAVIPQLLGTPSLHC